MNMGINPGDLPPEKLDFADIRKLISENLALQLQLKEANELISIKDEELFLLRRLQAKGIEIKSLQDSKSGEVEVLKQRLVEEKQKATGAQKREKEMADELDDTLGIYTKYNDLQKEYTHTMIKLEDAQALIMELKNRNLQLEEIAKRVGILESELQLILEEMAGK